jgi:hypothetical protein
MTLDMYDAARSAEKADVCGAISAELIWRGIEVRPCSAGSANMTGPGSERRLSDRKTDPEFSLRGH